MFSTPKGAFHALIYIHRYTPSTVSTVLNEYMREYRAKLKASLAAGRAGPNNAKEADRLRKILRGAGRVRARRSLPAGISRMSSSTSTTASKANYPKFGAALRKIAGLEAQRLMDTRTAQVVRKSARTELIREVSAGLITAVLAPGCA